MNSPAKAIMWLGFLMILMQLIVSWPTIRMILFQASASPTAPAKPPAKKPPGSPGSPNNFPLVPILA